MDEGVGSSMQGGLAKHVKTGQTRDCFFPGIKQIIDLELELVEENMTSLLTSYRKI